MEKHAYSFTVLVCTLSTRHEDHEPAPTGQVSDILSRMQVPDIC